ncbi:MAG TPA: PEGA domain-containing protein [Polyangia bacterium]
MIKFGPSCPTPSCFRSVLLVALVLALSLGMVFPARTASAQAPGGKAPAVPAASKTAGAAPTTPVEPALAPAPPPSRDNKKEEARRHFQQAVALYDEGNFAAALAEFQAAYDLAPAATVLYNLGLTEKALYRYSDAARTLERYLVEAGKTDKLSLERRQQVVQLIEEMKSLLAPVRFVLTPRDARVTVDGRAMTVADDGTVTLAAGSHVVDVTADGHESQRREITIAAGVPASYEFRLKLIPRTGTVSVTSSQAGTRVFIDGKDLGIAPISVELPAGGHQLEARADGFETYRGELVLAAGQQRNVDLALQLPAVAARAPVYSRWWFWTGIGTAVAGGTVAALLLRPGVKPPGVGTLDPGSFNVGGK